LEEYVPITIIAPKDGAGRIIDHKKATSTRCPLSPGERVRVRGSAKVGSKIPSKLAVSKARS
jgi:hypothetical protein